MENQIVPSETNSYKHSLWTLTNSLIGYSESDIADGKASDLRLTLYEAEMDIQMNDCLMGMQIRQSQEKLSPKILVKLITFILWSFQRNLRLPIEKTMDAMDMIICAGDYMTKYPCDTLIDLIYALRQARLSGMTFYGKFCQQDVFEILHTHFEEKARLNVIDNQNIGKTTTTISAETLKQINMPPPGAAPAATVTEEESYTSRMNREKALKMSKDFENNNSSLSEEEYRQLSNMRIIERDDDDIQSKSA